MIARRGAGPLALIGLDAHLGADAASVSVSVTVRNVSTRPTRGRVWWELARPGTSRPWARRVYDSGLNSVDLAPGDETRLVWSEAPGLPAGDYRLIVWAHSLRGETDRPSDSVSGPEVVLRPPPTSLLRHGPPRSGLSIAAVGPVPPTYGSPGGYDIWLDNSTPDDHQAMLQWSILRPLKTPLTYWWRHPTTPVLGRHLVTVPGGARVVVTLDGFLPAAPPSFLRVSLQVTGHGPGWPNADEWPDDDVLLVSPAR